MPVYKFRYVIDPDGAVVTPVTENVTADPKTGSTVNSIESIRVTFPDYTRVERSYIVDQLNMEIKVVDASGQTVSEGSVVQDNILQSSIDSITGADTVPAAVYTLQGVKVANPTTPGIYIVTGADGTTRKVVVR